MRNHTQFISKRLVLFSALALVYCYVSFHRVTMAIIGELLAKDFRLDPAQLGLLGGVLLYCYAFMQLPAGFFADHVGPKRTIVLSLVFSAAGSVVFAASSSFAVAILGRLLIGAGISCIYLSLIKILGAWFKENEFGTVLGILMALGMLGNLFATSPLAVSVDVMGWRNSYFLVGVLTLGLIALVYLRVRNAPDEQRPPATVGCDAAPEANAGNTREKIGGMLRTLRALMGNRSYLMLNIFMIAGSSVQGFQSLWAGPFLSKGYGFTLVEVGNALLWYSIGGIFGAPMWGFLSDRLFKSRKQVLLLGSVIALVAWFFPAFVPLSVHPRAVPALLFIMAAASGGGVLTHAMARESFSYEILGLSVGVINFFTFIGGAGFTQLMGHMVKFFPQSGDEYPLIAYQSTIMLIFAMWVVRLISLMLTEEGPANIR